MNFLIAKSMGSSYFYTQKFQISLDFGDNYKNQAVDFLVCNTDFQTFKAIFAKMSEDIVIFYITFWIANFISNIFVDTQKSHQISGFGVK